MANRLLPVLGLLSIVPGAMAGDPPATPPTDALRVSDRAITRRVDDLLRGSGTKLILDQDRPAGKTILSSETNKVYYHTSSKDQRLVRIEIEPVGGETPGSSTLAATFLHVLEAVGSVEDGVGLARRLSDELAKDGRTRFIALGNGVRFIKERKGDSSVRYIISL